MPQSRGHAARLAPLQACRATSGACSAPGDADRRARSALVRQADRTDDAPIPGPFGALLNDEADRTYVDVAFGQPQRYGAAVVLFEMATGGRPCYGPDENSNPATVDDDVTLRLGMFESTITAGMVEFFGSALSRHATARPHTAEDMLRAWRAVFTTLEETDHSDDIAAEKADTTTALAAAGLTARAVSALGAVQVTTVGELLALD